MKISRAVTVNIEAAHYSSYDSRVHGHSYMVAVYSDATSHMELPHLEAEVMKVRNVLDHQTLNDHGLSTMEDIAKFFADNLQHLPITKIVVERPSLKYIVEYVP